MIEAFPAYMYFLSQGELNFLARYEKITKSNQIQYLVLLVSGEK